jgi:hypothetical protein
MTDPFTDIEPVVPDPAQLDLFYVHDDQTDTIDAKFQVVEKAVVERNTRDPTVADNPFNLTPTQLEFADSLRSKSRALASKINDIKDDTRTGFYNTP